MLDLSFNNISSIEGLDNLPIQELNLKGNNIRALDGLMNLPYLSCLDVSHNYISTLAPLEQCSQLHYLNISSNRIKYIRQVEFLSEHKWLRSLYLSDNPCCVKPFYR